MARGGRAGARVAWCVMHAIRLHAFGPAENLRYEQVDDPRPGPGQARIAVAAAGVHLIDTVLREGRAMGPLPLPELPTIPGREVAGVVDAVGPGVDEQWLGRRVVAHLGPASGGYAELAVRDTDALHAVPDGVADDAAVAMIGTGRTALAVLEVAQLDDCRRGPRHGRGGRPGQPARAGRAQRRRHGGRRRRRPGQGAARQRARGRRRRRLLRARLERRRARGPRRARGHGGPRRRRRRAGPRRAGAPGGRRAPDPLRLRLRRADRALGRRSATRAG